MADLTSVANLLNTIVTPRLVDSTFLNREVFDIVPGGPSAPPPGFPHRFPVISAANSSGGVADPNGGPFPAPGQNTYLQASATPRLYDSAMSITKELEAAIQAGAAIDDIVGKELDKVVGRVYDHVAGDILSTTAPFGVELGVDSAGTYLGISHGTTGWGSDEAAVGGVLASSVLYAMEEALILPDRATFQNFSLVSHEQLGNYQQLSGAGTTTSLFRRDLGAAEKQVINMGIERRTGVFGDGVIFPIRDLANTIWLMGRREELEAYYYDTPAKPNALASVKGLQIYMPEAAGYSNEIIVAWYGIGLLVTNPFHWSKRTGITA